MNRRIVHVLCSLSLAGHFLPACLAASQPDLNFKIYSPPDANVSAPKEEAKSEPPKQADPAPESSEGNTDSMWSTSGSTETPVVDPSTSSSPSSSSTSTSSSTAASDATSTSTDSTESSAAATSTDSSAGADSAKSSDSGSQKVLQGYIRVVPSGTKIPIIMDTAIDTDTSQEGDEFAARSSEDLLIDGSTVVPAGSVIKGRIAALNNPKTLNRSGSVALKFDTVTTPDNRQIPLVANLVARGGVVHARRGLKDIAIDTGTFALPTALGLGIGVLAGSAKNNSSSSSSKMNAGTGALIGAGIGAAVGIAILAIKKGKKVDVRPGDELKIELAEDLRMPM